MIYYSMELERSSFFFFFPFSIQFDHIFDFSHFDFKKSNQFYPNFLQYFLKDRTLLIGKPYWM